MPFEISTLQQAQPQVVGTPEGARVAAARTEQSKPERETGKTSLSETVSLTDTAAHLQSLQNTVERLPVVDSERVEDIKRAIDNGTYEINPDRVAAKMMGLEQAIG